MSNEEALKRFGKVFSRKVDFFPLDILIHDTISIEVKDVDNDWLDIRSSLEGMKESIFLGNDGNYRDTEIWLVYGKLLRISKVEEFS